MAQPTEPERKSRLPTRRKSPSAQKEAPVGPRTGTPTTRSSPARLVRVNATPKSTALPIEPTHPPALNSLRSTASPGSPDWPTRRSPLQPALTKCPDANRHHTPHPATTTTSRRLPCKYSQTFHTPPPIKQTPSLSARKAIQKPPHLTGAPHSPCPTVPSKNNAANNDASPQPTPSKNSSQALRQMLAQARKSYKTSQNSPSRSATGESLSNNRLSHPSSNNQVLDQWGFQPTETVLAKAQQTGRLNLSSRSLSEVPQTVYHQLLPRSSIFHPSNRPKPSTVDLKLGWEYASNELGAHEPNHDLDSVPWFERVELTHINLSLNELAGLDHHFGGFDTLTACDLHHNQLHELPVSFGLLINLTTLNLSENNLSHFPLPILSLVHLRDLNLSKNRLRQLWSLEWKTQLKKSLATALTPSTPPARQTGVVKTKDPGVQEGDCSFNSSMTLSPACGDSSFSSVREDPFDLFPSSPTKTSRLRGVPADDNSPLPSLEKLDLSENLLGHDQIWGGEGGVQGKVCLPFNLLELSLSKNPVRGVIPIERRTAFQKLERLDFSGCELGDSIFKLVLTGIAGSEEEEGGELVEDGEETDIFPSLKELNLSFNTIDSLENLESFFEEACLQKKQIVYEGLPRAIQRWVDEEEPARLQLGKKKTLKVIIRNNFLRDELCRRRKARLELPDPSRALANKSGPQKAGSGLVGSSTKASDSSDSKKPSFDSAVESIPLETLGIRSEQPTPPPPPASFKVGMSQQAMTIQKYYNHAERELAMNSLNLKDQALKFLDEPVDGGLGQKLDLSFLSGGTGEDPVTIERIDLSKNQLTQIPLTFIHASCADTLAILDLSRNQIVAQSFSSSPRPNSSSSGPRSSFESIRLPSLVELNLSWNRISDEGDSMRMIELVDRLTSESALLEKVDLSFNQLRTDRGMYGLITNHRRLRREAMGASFRSTGFRFRFWVDLSGNRIEDVSELEKLGREDAEVVQAARQRQQQDDSMERAILSADVSGAHGESGLVIGLRDNCIRALPNSLGWLEGLVGLEVRGNCFRIPLRKVFDEEMGGGVLKLVRFLRERFSAVAA